MKELRKNFERFCFRHQNQGIPNLMLYLVIATAVVYCIDTIDPSSSLYRFLSFDRSAILHGQIWRLITYIILPTNTSVFYLALSLFFYYYIGQMIQNTWGTFRFNLYYFSGVLIMDIAALLLNCHASVGQLNLSLLLAYATLFSEQRVMIFYIIPVKLRYLAWFYFAVIIYDLGTLPFPDNLFPIFALLNYFLFFGADILLILPDFLRPKRRSTSFGNFGQKNRSARPNANWANSYRSASGQKPYHHKCTVCGRTDTENPQLEFRYCSKCNGYYCYCIDHINNHAHIQ